VNEEANMDKQQTKPGICPLCGSDNVTLHGRNLTGRPQAPSYSTCHNCEYVWYAGSNVPTAAELWRVIKARRFVVRVLSQATTDDTTYTRAGQAADKAYRYWLLLTHPETVKPYLPIR
jgi:hypothetical protein